MEKLLRNKKIFYRGSFLISSTFVQWCWKGDHEWHFKDLKSLTLPHHRELTKLEGMSFSCSLGCTNNILFLAFLFRRYPGQTRVNSRVSSEYWFQTDLWNCAKSWLLYRRTDRCNGSCWQSVVFNEGCYSYGFLNAPDFEFHHI